MSNDVYFSHGYACSIVDIDDIRRILKHLGYNVIEHTGKWDDSSMQKFLDCEYKLFLTPGFEDVGRGQAEMIESALMQNMKSFVITDYCTIEDAKMNHETGDIGKYSTPYISMCLIKGFNLTRISYIDDWATLKFDSIENELNIIEVFSRNCNSFAGSSNPNGPVKPILAVSLLR